MRRLVSRDLAVSRLRLRGVVEGSVRIRAVRSRGAAPGGGARPQRARGRRGREFPAHGSGAATGHRGGRDVSGRRREVSRDCLFARRRSETAATRGRSRGSGRRGATWCSLPRTATRRRRRTSPIRKPGRRARATSPSSSTPCPRSSSACRRSPESSTARSSASEATRTAHTRRGCLRERPSSLGHPAEGIEDRRGEGA